MILEFSTVLDRCQYEEPDPRQSRPSGEDDETFMHEILARRHFHVLMKVFYSEYTTQIVDKWVHPMYIVKVCLVQFAVALLAYRKKVDDKDTPCTLKTLLAAIETLFETDHSDLVPALKCFTKESDGWLT